MKIVGPHVHISGGVQNAPLNAAALKATGFGMFTSSPRRLFSKPLTVEAVDSFHSNMELCGYDPSQVLAHSGYLINLGQADSDLRRTAQEALLEEMNSCELLNLQWLNIHPGSHKGLVGEDECLDIVAGSINKVLDRNKKTGIVVETTAGQGSSVGYRFEHLAHIIDKTEDRSRIGVCIDTCHIFAAGYQIDSKQGYGQVMKEFDDIVSFRYLKGAHLNDSKTDAGGKVDRHENIGKGKIGLEPFRCIMNDSRFDNVPMILETVDESLWAGEIELLLSFGGSPE